jgi:hypothetical protein
LTRTSAAARSYRGVGNLFTLPRKFFSGWSPIAASAISDDTFAGLQWVASSLK